jgi:hypothetical protein
MVGYGVEGGWVEFAKCGVRVLAVEAFLESIDPGLLGWRDREGEGSAHGFPVEAAFVGDAAAVGEFGEIDGVG